MMNTNKDSQYMSMASRWSSDVNSFTFNPSLFCHAMSMEHKTLQQSFTRVCFAWIKHCASDQYNYDGRNEATHEKCKEIVKTMEEKDYLDWDALPFI